MNGMFNTTGYGHPYMGNMMYGGNYIDIMFRHLMEHGWEGITIMTFINFYMYLSLDKIKDLFKYANDKIAEYGKIKISEIGNNVTIDRIVNLLKTSVLLIKRESKTQKQIVVEKKCLNKATVLLNVTNKIDLMALGNYLLTNIKHLNLNTYQRENSDKYKTVRKYVLPSEITLNFDTKDKENDIIIRFYNNLNFTLLCESDDKMEVLKDIITTKVDNEIKNIEGIEFITILKNKLQSPVSHFPNYHSSTIAWSCDPHNFFCNVNLAGIVFYIFYTKNFELLKKLYNFTSQKGTLDLDGCTYKLKSTASGFSCHGDLMNENTMTNFIEETKKYCDKFATFYDSETKILIDDWIQSKHRLFDKLSYAVLELSFESATLNNNELLEYSKCFTNKLISDYYNQNYNQIGDKVSIYQLKIKYNVTIKSKDNPEYKKWEQKYGKKRSKYNKEQKQDKDADDSNNNNANNDTNNKTSNTNNNKTNNTNTNNDTNNANNSNNNSNMDDDSKEKPKFDLPYPYFFQNGFEMEPERFIEEEIHTPVVDCVHINSNKKDLKYLYLPKHEKDLLESYLFNFKNGRDLYEKYGICYKGGIILSGEPGCGKSSTILAIGTYLNKDIYYIDLGQFKTNSELSLCIEYIKTSSQKGGIIIFEDIDCMTDIVKQRRESTDNTQPINKTTNDDKLSLSFLLNVLDGTISPENIIFIMTTNHPELLDRALIRPGRIDISIQIQKCNKYQLQQIYHDLYGMELENKIANKFKENTFITAEVILHLFYNIYNKQLSQKQLLSKFLDN